MGTLSIGGYLRPCWSLYKLCGVNGQSIGENSVVGWGEEGCLPDYAVMRLCCLSHLSLLNMVYDPVALVPQFEFPFHTVDRRRPQRLAYSPQPSQRAPLSIFRED